jgi:large subunit ribosomal protein L17
MRHKVSFRKLSRTSSHRKALLKNLCLDLIKREKIVTTVPKAKELRPVIEKLITLGRTDSLHARRLAFAQLRDETIVGKLFKDLAERYRDTPGGYTRIVKLGERVGDRAPMAVIEFTKRKDGVTAEQEAVAV